MLLAYSVSPWPVRSLTSLFVRLILTIQNCRSFFAALHNRSKELCFSITWKQCAKHFPGVCLPGGAENSKYPMTTDNCTCSSSSHRVAVIGSLRFTHSPLVPPWHSFPTSLSGFGTLSCIPDHRYEIYLSSNLLFMGRRKSVCTVPETQGRRFFPCYVPYRRAGCSAVDLFDPWSSSYVDFDSFCLL